MWKCAWSHLKRRDSTQATENGGRSTNSCVIVSTICSAISLHPLPTPTSPYLLTLIALRLQSMIPLVPSNLYPPPPLSRHSIPFLARLVTLTRRNPSRQCHNYAVNMVHSIFISQTFKSLKTKPRTLFPNALFNCTQSCKHYYSENWK